MNNSENFNKVLQNLKTEVDNFAEISKAYKKLGALVADYKIILDNIKESNENIKLQKDKISSELSGISMTFTQDYNNVIERLDKSTDNLRELNAKNNQQLQNNLAIQKDSIDSKMSQLDKANRNFQTELLNNTNDSFSQIESIIQSVKNNIATELDAQDKKIIGLNNQFVAQVSALTTLTNKVKRLTIVHLISVSIIISIILLSILIK